MKYRVVAKKLKLFGCNEILERRSTGSHRIWANPITEKEASIPDRGGKELRIGTLRSILKQLEIDYQEFIKK